MISLITLKSKKLSFKNFKKIKVMRDSFNITVNIRFPRYVIDINMRMISPKHVVIITPPRKESALWSTFKRCFHVKLPTTDFFIHFSSCHSTFHKNHMRITILIRSTFSEKDREKKLWISHHSLKKNIASNYTYFFIIRCHPSY